MSRDIATAILGRTAQPKGSSGNIVEGTVHAISAFGMTFTVKSWDGGTHVFGPAPWDVSAVDPATSGMDAAHDHAGTKPTAGDRALIVFVGEGIENPWVVGWWPA